MAPPKDLPRFANLRSQAELDAEMRTKFLGRVRRINFPGAAVVMFFLVASAALTTTGGIALAVVTYATSCHQGASR